jgi:hypothetical protein
MRKQFVIACIIIITLWIITIASKQKNNDTIFQQPTRNQKLIGVQYALRDNNIPQAIHSMPSQRASDFYYRAQLYIQQAQILIQQWEQDQAGQWLQAAQADLQQAANKTHNPYLRANIRQAIKNQQIWQTLEQIQVCFTDFAILLEDLDTINTSIQQIIDNIQQQQYIIQQNSQQLSNIIEPECIEDIQKNMEETSQALTLTKQYIKEQSNKYQDIYTAYSNHPKQCIGTDIKPLLRDSAQTKNELSTLIQTYHFSLQALQLWDSNILNQMCQQSQDDSLSNQSLENAIQQLLQNLEQSTDTENSDQESYMPSRDPMMDPLYNNQEYDQQISESSRPTYIPITDEEKIILEQIQKTNSQRLETMMQIRSNDYNPRKKLDSLFEIFYPDREQFDSIGR